jgi:hypothetical protein
MGQAQRVLDELIGQSPSIWRIGDDVLGAGYRLREKINAGFAVPAVDKVARRDVIASP